MAAIPANPHRNIEGFTKGGLNNVDMKIVAECENPTRYDEATFTLMLQDVPRATDFEGKFHHATLHLTGGDLDGWLEVAWERQKDKQRGLIKKYYWWNGVQFDGKAPRSKAGVRRANAARAVAAAAIAAPPVPPIPAVIHVPAAAPAAAAAPVGATAAAAPARVSPTGRR